MRPTTTLGAFTFAAALAIPALGRANTVAPPPVVKITAHRFQFSPGQIILKKGETVRLQLTSTDAVHGFFARPLKIDTDIRPERLTMVTVTPTTTGTFKVICDHYRGIGHTTMKMTIVVE
ncbi:MAG: cupredoxin domain-containing protein [Candidatus Binataceae bacterium]